MIKPKIANGMIAVVMNDHGQCAHIGDPTCDEARLFGVSRVAFVSGGFVPLPFQRQLLLGDCVSRAGLRRAFLRSVRTSPG
nr:hypothetical protein [Kibdelosporangium sp. MJ126-NF4]CTQ99218.1 hypothetical protein [Kibdelosporangium sp. MJ126-NF4]